jgi:hypothetical protein
MIIHVKLRRLMYANQGRVDMVDNTGGSSRRLGRFCAHRLARLPVARAHWLPCPRLILPLQTASNVHKCAALLLQILSMASPAPLHTFSPNSLAQHAVLPIPRHLHMSASIITP